MIADERIPLNHVLQIWWSSVWTKEAHKSFIDKVGEILKSGSEEEFAPFRKNHQKSFLAHCKEKLDRDPVFPGSRPFFLPRDDSPFASIRQYNPQNVSNDKVRNLIKKLKYVSIEFCSAVYYQQTFNFSVELCLRCGATSTTGSARRPSRARRPAAGGWTIWRCRRGGRTGILLGKLGYYRVFHG